jgi:hypothetical protein
MIVKRNAIFHWLESVHDIWNLRRVQLFDLGHGRIGVAGVWTDDGPDTGRRRYPKFLDTFIFDLRTTSKWDLQTALWHRLEARKRAWSA